jgi:hypothetical protein
MIDPSERLTVNGLKVAGRQPSREARLTIRQYIYFNGWGAAPKSDA